MQSLGRHLLLELYDCSSEVLNSLETVKTALVEAARRAEATVIDVVFHEFNPFGISGVASGQPVVEAMPDVISMVCAYPPRSRHGPSNP